MLSGTSARRVPVGAWGGPTAPVRALMMITVTAIVYATLIGPYETLSGFALVTNPLRNTVVPAAWRGALVAARGHHVATLGFLPIPVAWVAHASRGTFTHQYFVNVWRLGRAGRDQHRGDGRRPWSSWLCGRGLADPQS